jgi:hypothetical protein
MSTPAYPVLTAMPGTTATPPLSPLYVDAIPVALVSPPPIKTPQAPSGQRFWSSHVRRYGDPTNEMMIVTFNAPRLLNYFSLDLPHFPSQYSLAWRDARGAWHWVQGPNGIVLQFIIAGSVPALVNSAAALTAGLNPYHYGAGHWIHYDEPIKPVTAGALLVAGTRALQTVMNISPGALPRDASGRSAPYPLGCRNLDFGYRALVKSDVPWTHRHPVITTERETFAVAEDINGSPVQLSMRENRASDLLGGLPWKCAPQPMSSAVVNLYADVRDPSGQPQVIDRFSVRPTTSGVSLNLYYTTSPPSSGFDAVDTPLGGPATQVNGMVLPVTDAEGLLFSNQPGWLDLAAQPTGIDFTSPWWAAWEIEPQFAGTDPGSYMVCDTGIVQLWFNAGTWYVTMFGGGNPGPILATWAAGHAVNDRLQFAAGWDGSVMYAWFAQAGSVTMTVVPSYQATTLIRFGATQQQGWAGSIWPGNYRLTSFILKQEAPAADAVLGGIPDQFAAFAAGPQAYTAPETGPGDTTVNACARFDASMVLGPAPAGLAPYGFAGGIGPAWDRCTWIPVQLSYKLNAGVIIFPPVRAAGFRFEFTDLLPQPYTFYAETPQKAQVFPVSGPQGAAPQPPRGSPLASPHTAAASGPNTSPAALPIAASADAGMIVNTQLAPQNYYADQARAPIPPPPGAALPTEAMYATDPAAAEALLAQGGSMYNFHPWQATPGSAPRQLATGTQIYQEVSVKAASKIAYFVGLSELVMLRMDYTASSDTQEYIDTFGDTAGLDQGWLAGAQTGRFVPWAWQPGLLTVPVNLAPGSIAHMESPVLNSMHQVTGVQFAALQSPPAQLLPDHGFTDPALPFVTNVGDAQPLTVSEGSSSPLGALVMVSRAPAQISWNAMMASYATWAGFAGPQLTWVQLQGNPITSPYGGCAYTGAPVTVSAAGRVHIAARVFASAPLTAPLFLQLLDGPTNAVVAEEEITVTGGIVTEWYASYTLGQAQTPSTLTWNQVAGSYPLWSSASGQTWAQIDTFVPPLGRTLSWQLVQYGLTDDVWGVDDVSIFEDSITWEFSNDGGATWWPAYDINANPSGALVFPPPAPGKGTQLKWRLHGYRPNLTVASLAIRPWYTCYPRGVPPRISGIPHGPNVTQLDTYNAIENDVYWQTWSGPVPQAWYFAYSQLLQADTSYTQPPPGILPPGALTLGAGLVVPLAETTIGPVSYSDIYSDAYTYTYGVPDGSDVYTDNGGNDVYQSITGPTP